MVEEFAFLDTILSDSLPKINKSKIKEIFEILKNQERLDLVEEMKTLLLLNTPAKDESKIHVSNESDFSLMNKVLPIEILKKILEKLDFRSVCLARQTCKYWNEIICKLKVAEKVSSKFV